jgi:hypothetical protein
MCWFAAKIAEQNLWADIPQSPRQATWRLLVPNRKKQLEIDVEVIPALYLPDITMIEFRNPETMRGGRVSITRQGTKLLVEFIDLDPGVEPVKAIADPVEAGHILDIVRYTIEWIEKMRKFSPTLVDNTKPLAFEGLATLKHLEKQLLLEYGENEPF